MRHYVPQGWRCDPVRWNRLIWWCRGYPEWKQKVNDIRLEYRASGAGSGSIGGGDASEIERKVERMERLNLNIQLLETCVNIAVDDRTELFQPLLTSVTVKVPQDRLNSPVSARQLRKYRREFFYLLDNELQKRGMP